jgi:hypothetical protein
MTVASDAAQSNGDVMRRLAELEAEVRQLRAERRLEAATIGAGGLTIRDSGGVDVRGGTVRFFSADGQLRIYLGPFTYPGFPTGTGFQFFRDTNKLVMSLEGANPQNQFWAIRSENGSIIFSDDAASGKGMATPWLAHSMGPSVNADTIPQIPGTTQGVFSGVMEASVPLTHPKIRLLALVASSDGATAGEGRWIVDGTVVGSTVVVPAGGAQFISQTVDVPGWADRAQHDEVSVQVQARRTAGTGRVVVAVYALYCRQS